MWPLAVSRDHSGFIYTHMCVYLCVQSSYIVSGLSRLPVSPWPWISADISHVLYIHTISIGLHSEPVYWAFQNPHYRSQFIELYLLLVWVCSTTSTICILIKWLINRKLIGNNFLWKNSLVTLSQKEIHSDYLCADDDKLNRFGFWTVGQIRKSILICHCELWELLMGIFAIFTQSNWSVDWQ